MAESVGVLAFLAIRTFAVFVIVVSVVSFVGNGANSVRGALIADVLPAEERVRARAFLRAAANLSMGVGAAVAAFVLQRDTESTYALAIVVDAVTFLVAAVLLLRVPVGAARRRPPRRANEGKRRRAGSALRDRAYLLIAGLSGAMSAHVGILMTGIPLWVAEFTSAPRWVISAAMVINTAMVVVLQVRLSRVADGPPGRAAAALRRGGGFLAAACVAIGLTHGLPVLPAVAVLLIGSVLYTVGEMLISAACWALSYDLAPPEAQGEYQGVFGSAIAVGTLLGPLLITSTAIRFGTAGWLLVAGLFALTSAVFVPVIRAAIARRLVATDTVADPREPLACAKAQHISK